MKNLLLLVLVFMSPSLFAQTYSNQYGSTSMTGKNSASSFAFRAQLNRNIKEDVVTYLGNGGKLQGVLAIIVEAEVKKYAELKKIPLDKVTYIERNEIGLAVVLKLKAEIKEQGKVK